MVIPASTSQSLPDQTPRCAPLNLRRSSAGGRRLRPAWDRLDDRTLLSGLTPAEVTAAYGLDGLTFTAANGSSIPGNGAGETIALIEAYHDPTLASDLQTFDQAYGLPNPALSVVDLAGPQVDYGWGLEESLDVEWAHAIAPAANILVVEASSQTLDRADRRGGCGPKHPRGRGRLDELGVQRVPARDGVQFNVYDARRAHRHHVPRRQRRQWPTGRARVALGGTDCRGRRRNDARR